MGKSVINQATSDLRQSEVDFCATPDGEGYELTVSYTPAERPRAQDDNRKTRLHDNHICFLLSAKQFGKLRKELRKGVERRSKGGVN